MWTQQREDYYARQNGRPFMKGVTPAQRRRLIKKQRRNLRIAWAGVAEELAALDA
jgi:hypothetical protein